MVSPLWPFAGMCKPGTRILSTLGMGRLSYVVSRMSLQGPSVTSPFGFQPFRVGLYTKSSDFSEEQLKPVFNKYRSTVSIEVMKTARSAWCSLAAFVYLASVSARCEQSSIVGAAFLIPRTRSKTP